MSTVALYLEKMKSDLGHRSEARKKRNYEDTNRFNSRRKARFELRQAAALSKISNSRNFSKRTDQKNEKRTGRRKGMRFSYKMRIMFKNLQHSSTRTRIINLHYHSTPKLLQEIRYRSKRTPNREIKTSKSNSESRNLKVQ